MIKALVPVILIAAAISMTAQAQTTTQSSAVAAAVTSTGMQEPELRARWGILLDVLDKRWLSVDGRDVEWRAFEWIEPGTSIRAWNRRCVTLGCGEPYATTITFKAGEEFLVAKQDGSSYRSTLRVSPDGSLLQENSCCKVGTWKLDGQILAVPFLKYREVSAEQLAQATDGASKSVTLAADSRPVQLAAPPASVPIQQAAAKAVLPAGPASAPAQTPNPESPGQARLPTQIDNAASNRSRTHDTAEQIRRFGDLAKFVGGQAYVLRDGRKQVISYRFSWKVPGAVMRREFWLCLVTASLGVRCSTREVEISYEQDGSLREVNMGSTFMGDYTPPDPSSPTRRGAVQADSWVLMTDSTGAKEKAEWHLDRVSGHLLVIAPAQNSSLTFEKTDRAEYAVLRENWLAANSKDTERWNEMVRQEEAADAAQRAEDQRSRPNVAQVFAETLGSEMRKSNAQQAQLQAQLNSSLARGQAEFQTRNAPPARAASTSTPSSAGQQSALNSNQATLSRPSPAVTPAMATRSEPQAVSPQASSWSRMSDSPSSAVPRKEAGPNHRTFPEAIFVCTRPNEAGNFRCASPVTAALSGGPKNGLAEWTTPERMVNAMSDACPDARRLASSTHLVWGCGFGATNNSNSMDRSAGVDVAGRRTYYCSERETSCRRTEH
ncbi:hypothetical protein [Variovorax sp. J22R115]|uniref:hypothetical protein n=1 Tax=Variovorax sp. J22R115 TaxID=3053509 RepID=UPI0025774418|nr:hypothetical protein [Variovorax sp. J22R115]MDM0053910.1 hypothetical protein [Variovorax sp. J22R115]